MEIKLVDQLSSEIEEKRHKDLVNYSKGKGINFNHKFFSLVITDNQNDVIIGALTAYTIFAEIYVDNMWIDSNYRNQGFGKKLINELEERFKGKGFDNINLVTAEFQAPEFYKKCGFELDFIRKNLKHPKLTTYFFVKYFDDEVQTQGII